MDFLYVVSQEGLKTWNLLRSLQSGATVQDNVEVVYLKNLDHPMRLRPGTEDVRTVLDTVVRQEYGRFQVVQAPRWLIDAGAYIGDTSAYFLSRFQELQVVALEPEPGNFSMAQQNLQPYGDRAVLLNKGLASVEQRICFGGLSTGGAIGKAGIEIECVDLMSLLEQFAIPHLDILKMDIEGAEKEIFRHAPEQWLQYVDMILLEIHGNDIEQIVSAVLRRNNFTMTRHRSVWYCQRKGGCP